MQNEDASLSIRSYPLIIQPFIAAQFATEMTQLNIWGQTALMIGRLQTRRNYLASLTATENIHRRELKQLRKDLETELTQLEMAADLYEKAKRESEVEQGLANVLQESIARLRARPEINRIDQAKPPKLGKVPRNRGATPLATPVAGLTSSGTSRPRQSLVHRSILNAFDRQIGNEIDSSSSDEEETSSARKRAAHGRDGGDSVDPEDTELGNQKHNIRDVTKEDLETEDENDRPPRTFAALDAKTPET